MEELIRHRRALHRIPELGDRLKQTEGYLLGVLEPLGCSLFRPGRCAVAAYFDFGRAKTVAIRADMDGLPVGEETGLPFASRFPGQSHACGHDGHMAILLGLCRWAATVHPKPRNNLLAIFQPAEETDGGARFLLQRGLFRLFSPAAVYGLHLWPDLPAGEIFCRPGAMMAQSREADLRLQGQGGHIASGQREGDALLAAAEVAAFCQERAAELSDRLILRFGQLQAGEARNAIACEAVLRGTVRSFSQKEDALARDILQQGLERAKQMGCTGSMHLSEGYPPVINHPGRYEKAKALLGEALSLLEAPVWQSEDFSFYQKAAPGLFFFLGCQSPHPLHHPGFSFDEGVLDRGLWLWQRLLEEDLT